MGVSIPRSLAGPVFLFGLLLIPSVAFSAPADVVSRPAGPLAPEEVRARLASLGTPSYVEPTSRGRERWKAVLRFYEGRGYRTAWVSGGRLTRHAESLLRAAAQSFQDGLDGSVYARVAHEARAVRRASASDWADPALDLDVRVSYALAR